jgi:hypothetical protein
MSDDGSEDPPAVMTRLEFPPGSRRRARRLAWLYMAAGIILLPWIVYLANTLPRRQFDRHYRAAWVGFDIFLVIVIIRTAYMAFRVDPRVQFPATATATLLVVDAWFDITTSGNRTAFFQAVVLAAFIEIPAAVFSIYIAHSVNRRVLELAHLEPPGLGDPQKNRGSPPPEANPEEAG